MALTLAFALTAMCVATDGAPVPESPPAQATRGQAEAPPIPHYSTWLSLVQCEASGNWHSATNPRYKGGLQFDGPTWARHGGLEYAWRADFATPEEQMLVAERTLGAQGWGAWPVCARRLGLR